MVSHNDLLHKGLALSAGVPGVLIISSCPSALIISSVPGSPRFLKIPAGILRHLTILKHHAQIPELIILHINILYVQQSFCPLQYGGCKTSPNGMFTSDTQFSKLVSFSLSLKGWRATFMDVSLPSRPVMST